LPAHVNYMSSRKPRALVMAVHAAHKKLVLMSGRQLKARQDCSPRIHDTGCHPSGSNDSANFSAPPWEIHAGSEPGPSGLVVRFGQNGKSVRKFRVAGMMDASRLAITNGK
jgi:hypothetical protein